MTEEKWICPYDPACPPRVAEAGMPVFRLVTAVMDELPDGPKKWAMSLALGTSNLTGMTLAAIAAKSGTGELALLRAATAFCQRHAVRPSPHLQHFAAARTAAKGKQGAMPAKEANDAPQAALEAMAGH
jgi:hypothetical protein